MADPYASQVGPGLGAFFAGQNQANNVAMDRLKQQELADLIQQRAAEAQQKQQMNPLMLEHQRILNQQGLAQLPGLQADSRSKTVKANTDEQTQGSAVAAAIAKNDADVGKSRLEKFQQGQTFLMQAGAGLENVPAPLRGQAFTQMITDAGMNPNAPHFQAMLKSDPNMMPKMAQALAERLGQQALAMNPAAQASMFSARESAAAHRYGADQSLKGVQYAADERTRAATIKAEASKKGAVDTLTLLKQGKIAPDRALVQAQIGYATATSEEEKAMWQTVGVAAQEAIKFNNTARGEGKPGIENGEIKPQEVKGPFDNKGPKAGQTSSGVKYKIITD